MHYTIFVDVQDGIIQGVTHNIAGHTVTAIVRDYDTDGAPEDELRQDAENGQDYIHTEIAAENLVY